MSYLSNSPFFLRVGYEKRAISTVRSMFPLFTDENASLLASHAGEGIGSPFNPEFEKWRVTCGRLLKVGTSRGRGLRL